MLMYILQTGAHYAKINIFNHPSTHMRCVVNEMQIFKSALKRFILSNSFHSTQEDFNYNK
jgi:hypothetical protein